MAFLKTPNVALNPADIPKVGAGDMPSNGITLQHLVQDDSLYAVPECDAAMAGTGVSPPPNITLERREEEARAEEASHAKVRCCMLSYAPANAE